MPFPPPPLNNKSYPSLCSAIDWYGWERGSGVFVTLTIRGPYVDSTWNICGLSGVARAGEWGRTTFNMATTGDDGVASQTSPRPSALQRPQGDPPPLAVWDAAHDPSSAVAPGPGQRPPSRSLVWGGLRAVDASNQ